MLYQANLSEAFLGPSALQQIESMNARGSMTTGRKKSVPGTGATGPSKGHSVTQPSSKMKRQNRYFSPNQQKNVETQFEDLTLPAIPQRREVPYTHAGPLGQSKAASMGPSALVSPERQAASTVRARQQALHKYSKSNASLSTSRRPPGV